MDSGLGPSGRPGMTRRKARACSERPLVCASGPEALRGQFRALPQRLELRPGDLRMYAAAQPAVGRRDDLVAPDSLGEAADAVCDDLRMLDQIGRVGDDAG